ACGRRAELPRARLHARRADPLRHGLHARRPVRQPVRPPHAARIRPRRVHQRVRVRRSVPRHLGRADDERQARAVARHRAHPLDLANHRARGTARRPRPAAPVARFPPSHSSAPLSFSTRAQIAPMERGAMSRAWIAPLCACMVTGCLDVGEGLDEPGAEPGDEPATGEVEQGIYKTDAFGWGRDSNGVTTTVPICWDERDYFKGPAEPDRSTIKDFVRRAIEETWQRESGVMFSGWGDCLSGGGGTFGIDLHMETGGRGMTYVIHPFWE